MFPNGEGGKPIQRFYCSNFTAGLSNRESPWRGNQTFVFMAFFALGCFCRADSNPPSGDLLEFAAVHFCVRDGWNQQPQGQERKKCWALGHHREPWRPQVEPWSLGWLPGFQTILLLYPYNRWKFYHCFLNTIRHFPLLGLFRRKRDAPVTSCTWTCWSVIERVQTVVP